MQPQHARLRIGLLACTLAAPLIPLKALAVAGLLLSVTQAQAYWPTVLSSNSTGFADSFFLGPPDESFVGLGAAQVTYDFGPMVVVNRTGAKDLNIYEWDGDKVEIDLVRILVSQDGDSFFDITANRAGAESRIPGDGLTAITRIKGFDLGDQLDWVRYVRVQGIAAGPAGGTNGFELDTIGAFELMPAPPVPEPGTWALMLVGLAAVGRLMRRQQEPQQTPAPTR
jgi:hypothetical protein